MARIFGQSEHSDESFLAELFCIFIAPFQNGAAHVFKDFIYKFC